MRVNDILNEEADYPHYKITKVDREDEPQQGSSKKGTIKVNYHKLVSLFGEPQDFTNDRTADINFEWNLSIQYVNEEGEEDFVDVSIYDYKYGSTDERRNPTQIEQWTVGSKTNTGYFVLLDLLEQAK